ncbi:hypothetical protein FACS1894181_12570 [Bacteroidia bacterium]|nr:hypothetical protein FACS1894181_12570 [Bacteroidia bacterium]
MALHAQTIDQIGVLWSKTYGTGYINNLKPIRVTGADGGYVAAGRDWNTSTAAGIGRCSGLVLEIDESGNEIRRATATIPQTYINTHSDLSAANATFQFAFKTNDGGYLAFGFLQDQNAPEDEKEYDHVTGTPKGGSELTNGLWIVQFNNQLQVVSNTMERGRRLSDGWQMADGNFLVGGFDAAVPAGSTNGDSITLLRKYNQSGEMMIDKRGGYRNITAIYQYPGTDTYLAATPDRVVRINSSLDTTSTTISSLSLPEVTYPYTESITPSLDGGFFISTRLNSNSNATINYNNGRGIYKVSSGNTHLYNKRDIPADSIFDAPLSLPGSAVPVKYIGAMRASLGGANYSQSYMYELTDDDNFTFRVGGLYPDGTTLRAVSQSDGFFSTGSSGGNAAIAKLSTCVNFRLNVGSTEEQLLLDDTSMAAFAERNIASTGNIGAVTYKWDLRDITPDGAAVVNLGTISGTTNTIPAAQFTLAPGKESAVLLYTITAKDDYVNNGVPQTCQQTENIIVRINRYPDLATVQKYYSVEIPVLANDSLPASILTGISIKDSVSIPPKAGILNGAGQRLIYTNTGAPLENNIDSFLYKITFQDPRTSTLRTFSTWVYIYVLDDKNGAAGCYLQPYTVKLSDKPTGVTFDWYNKTDGAPLSPLSGSTRVVASITADASFLIQPKVPDPWYTRWEDFPQGDFTIKLANPGGATTTMRWTGLTDSLWQNPANWVEVKSGYEAPASFAPTKCVNVIIPSTVDYFPELVDSAYCNDILMKDRAMLKNPHVLVYRNASVEIKLKPAERDRFVMWSAPLKNMYSGDYHYRINGQPYFGDTYINYFQEANPDPQITSPQATAHHFTATTGSLDEPLELGRAFNVKVATTTMTRDSLLRFPRTETTYNGMLTPALDRRNSGKFITDGKSGVFEMWVSGASLTGVKLVQVVNPYLAYLDFNKFAAPAANDLGGYYTWSGDLNDGFAAIVSVMNNGNRIRIVNTDPSYSPDPTLIPPLQSFFIPATRDITISRQVKMSSDWTTVRPPSPTYSLRTSKKTVSSGGVLHITLSQGEKKAYAALLYNPSASNFTDPEDMPAIIYDELPLAVYTISMNEALAINSSSTFDMFPVPIGFRATTAGETKLEFNNHETFGYEVVLIDKVLNKRIDLGATPAYTFTFTVTKTSSAPVEINDRFTLEMKYTGNGVTITGNETAPPPSALQVSAGAGYIYIKSEAGVISSLQIYDTVGRLVYGTSNLNERQLKLPVNGKQMYIVKATIGEATHVEKTMPN